MFDVAIVGGGIVGLATAWRLLARNPGLSLVLLEAEPGLASHQTGHNSGVIHSGLYYKPGSRKATNCVQGRDWLYEFLTEHDLPHERCGKLVVATTADEVPALDELERRGKANGLVGIERLSAEGILEHEPHVRGVAALYCPQTGVVDYSAVAARLSEQILELGGTIERRSRVIAIRSEPASLWLETERAGVHSKQMIACAGLECDRVARLAGIDPGLRIVPFRGEYYRLVPDREYLVRHLVYPVPDARFPFLGVHFTRRLGGGIECGPNAVLSFAREGYERTSFDGRDSLETLSHRGFRRVARRFLAVGVGEWLRSLSPEGFARSLRKLVPEITAADIVPAGAGVRAQAISDGGELVDDFRMVEGHRSIHVLNAPSPAATACLSIGDGIARRAMARWG